MEDRDFSRYNSVLIIGNGFDLNLGLPTSYTNFLKSEEFEQLIKGGNKLCEHLKSKHDLQNWIDIENELTIYSSICLNNLQFLVEFTFLRKQLTEYIKKIKYDDIKKDSPAYNLLCDFCKHDNQLIIDFNYTESVKYILNKCSYPDAIIDDILIKIHGTANQGNTIFGVEDKANIRQEHVFLRKAAYLWYNPIDLPSLFKNTSELIFFGHSLGKTDHGYFEDLFRDACNSEKEKKFVIHSYQGRGYDQIMEQIDILTAHNISPFRQRNDVKFILSIGL